MSLLGNLTVGILGNASGLSDSFSQAQNQVSQFSRQMEDIGQSLTNAGSAITQTFGPAFAALGGIIGLTAKKAMDFESQMSSVKSVMSPDEVVNFGESLEKLAIQMGAETKYSSLEAAQGIEELIKAGVGLEDIINGGLKGALSLAVAGELDLASASEIASTALNAFKDDNLTVIRAADLLAGAANASATSVSEMKFGLSMASAVAAGVGLTFEETSTALASFAQNGLKGSDAGTSLKTMLLNLSPSTEGASTAMAELGLLTEQGNSAFYDAQGSVKSLADIAELLKTKLAGLTDEQRQMALKTMFGTDAIRAANILYKEGADGINQMNEAMNKITAADVAATKLDNVKGRIEILKGTIETAAISIGNAFLPVIDQVVGAVQKMTNWFNSLSPEMTDLIAKVLLGATALTGLATAFGVILMVVGGVISSVGTIAGTFALLSGKIAALGGVMGILTGPIGLTIAAVVALGAALFALWNKSETFRNSVTEIFNKVKDVAVQAFGIVSSFIQEKLGAIKTFWDENGSQFLQAVENVFNGIMAVVNFVMPAIKFIIEMVWTAIKQVISGALEVIMGVIKVFSGLFTGDFGKMWEGIKQIFFGAIDVVIGWMTLTFVGGLKTLFLNLAKSGLNIVKGLADGIVNFFKSFATTGQNLANGFVNSIVGFFRNLVDAVITLFNLFRARGASQFEAFRGVVMSIFNSIKSGLMAIWNGLISFLTNGASIIWNGVTAAFRGMLNGISSIFGTIKGTVQGIWNGVVSFFNGINLFSIGKNIIQGLANGIGSMASAVWEKAKSIASGIGNSIKKALQIKSPSRVMMGLGEFAGEGLAVGLENTISKIQGAAGEMALASVPNIPPIDTKLNAFGNRGAMSTPINEKSSIFNIQPAPVYLDDQLIGEIMFDTIDNKFASNTGMSLYMRGERK
jgi:TP901 family phage tail tape measure protein